MKILHGWIFHVYALGLDTDDLLHPVLAARSGVTVLDPFRAEGTGGVDGREEYSVCRLGAGLCR